ncbi:MAG: hypothetical protein V7L09_33480 [Nostoc sp.]|uniref:hypothetical protein n=1 Tax=Nostoc sp. TaxID=1180 RepID=UPI002FF0A10A
MSQYRFKQSFSDDPSLSDKLFDLMESPDDIRDWKQVRKAPKVRGMAQGKTRTA